MELEAPGFLKAICGRRCANSNRCCTDASPSESKVKYGNESKLVKLFEVTTQGDDGDGQSPFSFSGFHNAASSTHTHSIVQFLIKVVCDGGMSAGQGKWQAHLL